MAKTFKQGWRWAPLVAALGLGACGGSGGAAGTPASPVAAATPATQTTQTTLALPAGYTLVWSDEFNVNGLPDAAKWNYDTGRNKDGWYNNELQYYSAARLENAEARGGSLVITARKEQMSGTADWGGQRYSSARLLTAGKASWTYGYFEVRAKLPCGKGTWPAIWMLGSGGDWPAVGELDIMEQTGREPTKLFSTTHTTSGSGGNGAGGATQVSDACTAFHTYQMLWTAQQITFGIDGKAHFTYVNAGTGKAQWPFDAPQFLILNVAIGGDLGGPVDDAIFPVKMEVDFVRVYQAPK